MKFQNFWLLALILILSCHDKAKKPKNIEKTITSQLDKFKIDYAKGFEVESFEDYYILKITEAWPGAEQDFTYILQKRGTSIDPKIPYDVKVEIPLQNIVVTSTTHIPSLESLGVLNQLIGFPNTNYISSPKTRQLIDNEKIKDIGQNQSFNTELLISLQPDAVVSFAVKGENKSLESLKKAGFPVLYNADWVEKHPLGKAEWIKFFGLLFDKVKKSQKLFDDIKNEYELAKRLASETDVQPSVISGALWKDQWYLPAGESWQAQIITDANAKYLYNDTEGTGSLSLAFESVLDKAQDADIWIAPAQYTSYQDMIEQQSHYKKFKAFRDQKVYTFASTQGETGGVLYYELAPNRPDWVLKDLIKIFHPDLLPDYKTHFYKPLNP